MRPTRPALASSTLCRKNGVRKTTYAERINSALGALCDPQRGYLPEALKEFRKALQDMQEKDRVYIEMGKVHIAEKDGVEALAFLLKALEEALKSEAADSPAAQAMKEALEDLKQAIEQDQQLREQLADTVKSTKKSTKSTKLLNPFAIFIFDSFCAPFLC